MQLKRLALIVLIAPEISNLRHLGAVTERQSDHVG